jgi:hypothetical protein
MFGTVVGWSVGSTSFKHRQTLQKSLAFLLEISSKD